MSIFITKKEIFKIVAKSLQIDEKKITEKSSMNNLDEWDSMSHLGILIELDKKLLKKAQKIQELAGAYSIKKIIEILNKNNLLK
jgi:acyl carrier protein